MVRAADPAGEHGGDIEEREAGLVKSEAYEYE